MELKLAKSVPDEASAAMKEKPTKRTERACNDCDGSMKELKGSTSDGLDYVFFKCMGCGTEMASTDQLQKIAAQSRALKTYSAKITKWGQSLGIRIPKELVTMHNMSHNEEVTIVPEEGGFRILPSKKNE